MPNLNAQLRNYLKERDSPLANYVPDLIRAGRKHRVDPRLIVAISNAETSLGKAGNGPSVYNAWGIGPGKAYKSWSQGINEMAKLLRTGYLNEGRNSFQSLYPKYVWGKSSRNGDPEADWVRNASGTYQQLGGNPNNVTQGWKNASAPASSRVQPMPKFGEMPGSDGMPDFTLESLKRVAGGGSAVAAFRSMVTGPERWAKMHPKSSPPPPPGGTLVESSRYGAVPKNKRGKVTLASSANRPGVDVQPIVTNFLSRLGQPISIGTGTNHNRLTVNGRVSDHWDGHAADIPADGDALTRLGRKALIAAGMPPAQAAKIKGGLFNLNWKGRRVQVIFNTTEGGNHWNHLHVGIR